MSVQPKRQSGSALWLTLAAAVVGALLLAVVTWVAFVREPGSVVTDDPSTPRTDVAAVPSRRDSPANRPAGRNGPAPQTPTQADPLDPSTTAGTPTIPPPTSDPKPPPAEPLVGFTITAYDQPDPQVFYRAIDELDELGFNAVQVLVPVFASSANSRGVQVLIGPHRSASARQIASILEYAGERGMHTMIAPIVIVGSNPGQRRVVLDPPDWDDWWRSYRHMLDQMIDWANSGKADALCVGSELISTENQPQRWVELIAHARSRFNGYLTYAANWERYDAPAFWAHLDMIGVNGYFDLTSQPESAGVDTRQIARRWEQARDEMLAFAAAQDRPLLMTEVGYPSTPWALSRPSQPALDATQSADYDAQNVGYATFIHAFRPLLTQVPQFDFQPTTNELAGAFFYEWELGSNAIGTDTGYGIHGKPAYHLVRAWLSADARPDIIETPRD